ncbi:MAG: sodium-dependent transporter [Alistipes indistinctus]
MPFMILLLIGLVINSLTLDGAKEGISFLLRPDFSKINSHVILQALGQAFFSLSLGMGTMITYGSYIPKNENMFRLAGTVAVTDTCVAILAGLAIFPAVFSYGISPTSGPELVFITLPNVFGNMTGGYLLGIAFFFLLFTASISSSVSLLEVATLYISEEMHLRRRTATLIAVGTVAGLSARCASGRRHPIHRCGWPGKTSSTCSTTPPRSTCCRWEACSRCFSPDGCCAGARCRRRSPRADATATHSSPTTASSCASSRR